MLESLIEWLAGSAVSQWVQSTSWAIPALQSLHILSISAVTATSFIVSLRVFGLLPAVQPLADLIAGSLRAIWTGIAVLLLSGSLLVIAEPRDILPNGAFQLKMVALLCAAGLLAVYPSAVRSSRKSGTLASRSLKWLAASSLVLLLAIAVAGRWIAYS
jgi:hypothetical protein